MSYSHFGGYGGFNNSPYYPGGRGRFVNNGNINNIMNPLISVFYFTGLTELAAVLLCLIGLVIGVIWMIVKRGEENRD